MKKRVSVWDVIAWIVLIGILIWIFLKMIGIINTPILVEYAPYFGSVYLAGWAMHKLETASRDIGELKIFKDVTISEINKVKENCIRNHR